MHRLHIELSSNTGNTRHPISVNYPFYHPRDHCISSCPGRVTTFCTIMTLYSPCSSILVVVLAWWMCVTTSSIHLHYVLLGTLYRSALVPPGTLHHKPPRMGGTTFFLFIFITTTTKRIQYCTIIKFKNLKKMIPYLLFERFTFDNCSVFVHVCH